MQRDSFQVEQYPSLERFQSGFRDRTLNVCIATEEIIGPVRNGGIASTYYHLARGLARQGHKVTVLYLKGRKVENETPEHWITHFASFGIELVFLDFVDQPLVASSERWQRTYYSFYLWLKQNDRFDVIHTSEWRGGAFYCLQAKRLGLEFQNTFFIVKTSSPHIWNRHYQMQPIDEADMMSGSFAEQKCVEWADMVVGGSAHLLSFMEHIGYTLPAGRTYVQPNIIDFSEVVVTDLRPERQFGDIMYTRELVFFGRLEPRKGLDLFVNAINLLVSRGVMPARVSFLGKEGERLANYGGIKPLEFIAANAKAWPFETEVLTNKNQPEALSYMCQRDMIAIMPSLIENSTMAVYEALVHKIPFVATAVGGTPELIAESDREACLISPSAEELANRIEVALREGHRIAAPAFDNDLNLETWYAFHRFVAEHGTGALSEAHGTQFAAIPDKASPMPISYIAFASTMADLIRLVENLRRTTVFDEMLVGTAFPLPAEYRLTLEAALPRGLSVIECVGLSAGDAFNRFRAQAKGDILVFDTVCRLEFDPRFAGDVRRALHVRPGSICTTAVRFREDPNDPNVELQREILLLPIGDIASQYATGCAYGIELIAMRAATCERVGAFELYNLSSGIVHEYVSRAILAGTEFQIIPEPDIYYDGVTRPWESPTPNYEYMKSKSLIDSVPLPLKKILLFHLGQAGKGRIRRTARKFVANAGRTENAEGEIAWLTNARGAGKTPSQGVKQGSLIVGFDVAKSRIHLGLHGWGHLRVLVNEEEVLIRDDVGRARTLSVTSLDVLPLFDRTDRIWVKIEFTGDGRRHQRTVALQKFEDNVHFISSGRLPIFWGAEFETTIAALTAKPAQVGKPAAVIEAPPLPAPSPPKRRAPPRPPANTTRRRAPELDPASEEEIAMLVAEARKIMAEYSSSFVFAQDGAREWIN